MSASQARAAFSEVLDRVERGEEVTITRHDKPVAMVVLPSRVVVRRAAAAAARERAAELGRQLEAARHEPLFTAGSLTVEQAERWIDEIRQDRDEDPWTRSTPTS